MSININTSDRKRYAVKSGSRQSIQNTRDAIRSREDFATSGALYGRQRLDTGWGHLRGAAQDRFIADRASIDYVVVSYRTPIAWHLTDGAWVVVTDKFSPTTTSHQSAVSSALGGYGTSDNIGPVPYVKIGWSNR